MSKSVVPLLVFLSLAACEPQPTVAAEAVGAGKRWSLRGDWTDACCCKVACPCLFGSKPTERFCQGASLVEITDGHFEKVDLDGVAVVVTYHVGKWAKFYVSDRASAAQKDAVASLLPELMPFLRKGPITKVEQVPIVIEKAAGKVRYAVPETEVALALLPSASGQPIKLQNLPAKGTPFPQAHDHTQYKASMLVHRPAADRFEHTGRNGFTSTLDVRSSD